MARTSLVRRGWPEIWPEIVDWPETGFFGDVFRAMRGEGIRLEEYVDDGTLVVRAELPGIDPDKDVNVSITEGMLRIEAERKESQKKETAEGFRSEFHYGAVTRVLPLPAGTTEKDVKATYADGVLEIRVPIPKAEEAQKAHKVPVQRGA